MVLDRKTSIVCGPRLRISRVHLPTLAKENRISAAAWSQPLRDREGGSLSSSEGEWEMNF